MSQTIDLFKMFSDRRQAKMASGYEKARAQAALDQTNDEIGFRGLEDPREQAQMRQELAARGLGRSSIADQNRARLTDIQARRMAALNRQKGIEEHGLSLIKRRRKHARRIFPLQLLSQAVEAGKEISTGAPGGSQQLE